MGDTMNFEKIKYMREYYDYSQSFVAKKLNVQRGTYAAWECGSDMIPIQKLVLLANLFECNLDYLFGLNPIREKNISKFDPNIVPQRLKEIRNLEHLSLREIAENLSIDYSTYSKNENGKNYPTTYTIYEIAKKYGYSLDWITGRKKEKKLLVTE